MVAPVQDGVGSRGWLVVMVFRVVAQMLDIAGAGVGTDDHVCTTVYGWVSRRWTGTV